MKTHIWATLLMILGAAAYRVLPHPTNLAPVAAMALVSGAAFQSRFLSIATPLLAMFASDVALQVLFGTGFHTHMLAVYGALVLTVIMGSTLKGQNWGRIVPTSFLASTAFFVITNLSVWAFESAYPKTGAGLLACYIAAIPFFDRTLFGDLFFTGIFFSVLKRVDARALVSASYR